MKKTLPLFLLPLLTGCLPGESKEAQVCLDLSRSVITDPSSLKVNSLNTQQGPLSAAMLEHFLRGKAGGELTTISRLRLDAHRDGTLRAEQTFIEIDFTHDSPLGKRRDQSLCQYIELDGKVELASFTYRGRDVEQHQFMQFFMQRQRPELLSPSYTIKE